MATFSGGRLAGPFDAMLRYNGAAISGPATGQLNGVLRGAPLRKSLTFGGADYVAGVVEINDVPRLAYVRVHDQISGLVVAGGWTDAAGNFSFPNLRADLKWYAIAFDPVTREQAVIYDQI